MKNFIFAVVVALVLLIFCTSCGWEVEIVDPTEPSKSEAEKLTEEKEQEFILKEEEKPEISEKPKNDETEAEKEQETGTLENGAVFIGELAGENIYVLEDSKITKPHRLFDEDNKQYLVETERKLYKLLDSNGIEIIPHFVESYDLFVPGSMGNEGENHLYCVYEGNLYIYDADKDFELISISESGPIGESLNGFEVTLQYWEAFYPYMLGKGLNNSNGSVFLEPIYQRIEAPFADRFLAEYGIVSQAVECIATDIIDIEGNVLSNCFNAVDYYFLDDGSYIGVGRYYGGELICRDENGNEYEKGNWFIDKDGNKISENFSELSVDKSGYMESFKLGTSVRVTTSDGENKILPIDTYAIKP